MKLRRDEFGSNSFNLGFAICSTFVVLVGCSNQQAEQALEREQSELKTLTLAYARYMRDQGNPPRALDDFKSYVQKNYSKYLEEKQLTVDQMFTSPRDNKPFVFATGSAFSGDESLVGYEQEGVAGKRLVSQITGVVMEWDEERFQAAVQRP